MLKFGEEEVQNERKLSQFTMENIHEAVFWIDSHQHIIHVNEAACRLSGYTREELTRKKVTDLNPSAIVMDWPTFWNRLREEKKIIFEAQHLHKEGYYYDVEITGNFIKTDGEEYSCSIVRDIRRKKREEEILRTISENTSGVTGTDYFRELAKYITE